jgi:hypothetical protein
MAIAVTTTKQDLSNYYVSLGNWLGAATSSPGSTPTPDNEVTGGTPPYGRAATTWTAGTGGVNTGSPVTLNLPEGTITYILLASAATLAAANMIDNAAISAMIMSAQGQLVITPIYTQR